MPAGDADVDPDRAMVAGREGEDAGQAGQRVGLDGPEDAGRLDSEVLGRQDVVGPEIARSRVVAEVRGVVLRVAQVRGVRAALCNDLYAARMSRLHNDANVLSMGGRIVGFGLAEEIVKTWLETPFEGGRHQRRLDQIAEIERS